MPSPEMVRPEEDRQIGPVRPQGKQTESWKEETDRQTDGENTVRTADQIFSEDPYHGQPD